jgi:hypothetical protein
VAEDVPQCRAQRPSTIAPALPSPCCITRGADRRRGSLPLERHSRRRAHYTQQKTGKPMEVRLHRDLARGTGADAQARHHDHRQPGRAADDRSGHPPRAEEVRRRTWQGAALVPHGLRKNAVNALLEAGCTGLRGPGNHRTELQMIAHYARKVNRRTLGDAGDPEAGEQGGKVQTDVQTWLETRMKAWSIQLCR